MRSESTFLGKISLKVETDSEHRFSEPSCKMREFKDLEDYVCIL